MKENIKNSGIVLIVIGVIFLLITYFREVVNNTSLVISGGLIVVGLLSYAVLNNYMD